MRLRILLVAAVAALYIGVLPTWAQSQATGINCSNFTYQEDAQAYFDAHPGDPEGLDGPPGPAFEGLQNVACEALPHRPVLATTSTIRATTTTSGAATTSGQTAIITTTTVPAAQSSAKPVSLTG